MKKISLPKVLSVLVITFLAFAFSFVLPFVGVYVADADQDFYENFESYALGNASASGLTEKWDISSVTGNDRTEIKTDPENENNKVLSIRSIATDDYYYFLSPKALRMKNFEISFKVWFVDTHIKNGWIAVACRKETNVKYDSTKCALLTLNNNSNKRDAMEYQPLTFDGDIKNVMTDIDNGITYGIDKTFVYERWYANLYR